MSVANLRVMSLSPNVNHIKLSLGFCHVVMKLINMRCLQCS